jgi:hypothetical protein
LPCLARRAEVRQHVTSPRRQPGTYSVERRCMQWVNKIIEQWRRASALLNVSCVRRSASCLVGKSPTGPWTLLICLRMLSLHGTGRCLRISPGTLGRMAHCEAACGSPFRQVSSCQYDRLLGRHIQDAKKRPAVRPTNPDCDVRQTSCTTTFSGIAARLCSMGLFTTLHRDVILDNSMHKPPFWAGPCAFMQLFCTVVVI